MCRIGHVYTGTGMSRAGGFKARSIEGQAKQGFSALAENDLPLGRVATRESALRKPEGDLAT